MHVKQEFLTSGLSSWNNKIVVETLPGLVNWLNNSLPANPASLQDIPVVVEAGSLLWELDLGGTLPAVAEANFILFKGGTEGPHTGENEEGFIDLLDLLFNIILLKFLQVVVLLLVSRKFLAELVDDGGQRVNLSEFANRCNVLLVSEIVEE